MSFKSRFWVLALPLAFGAVCWLTMPFPDTLYRQQFSLGGLTSAQKVNLAVAIASLNGMVLKPGDVFSFNRTVGPRTSKRGYLPAPSYVGTDSPATPGGGICLLSSALYGAALTSGFHIQERVSHLRPVRSVPAGLDAAVWYGQADLKFRNTMPNPVRLDVALGPNTLTVMIQGKGKSLAKPVRRVVARQTSRELQVLVYQGNKLLSRDLYRRSQEP